MAKQRIGVYGAGRGAVLGGYFAEHEGTEIVAGCDRNEATLKGFAARFPQARLFKDYDDLLACDFDVLILAGYAHEHGPDAVKALQAGKHVFSEVTAFHTPAEGVALVEAVERAGRQYMMGEQFCYLRDVVEMQRIFSAGQLGEFLYGDGEYVQDCRRLMTRNSDGTYHWRSWLPPFYYNGHALGPLLQITGTRPVSVVGLSVVSKIAMCRNPFDFGACLVRLDNGGVMRILASFSALREPNAIWFSVYGTKGEMESSRMRVQQPAELTVYRGDDPSAEFGVTYLPRYGLRGQAPAKAGHGEGNYHTARHFLEAVRANRPPALDIYRACDITLPGMLAYRSSLEGGKSLEVPDFRDRLVRDRYRHDDFRCPTDAAVRKDQEPPPWNR